MDFREEILNERKKKLGLDMVDTKKVFETILNGYKKEIVNAKKEIIGYTIDIAICNMNGYNRLGTLENLYKNLGDNNYYIDLKNSFFVEIETNDDGDTESYGDIPFQKITEFEGIKDTAFSIKELIDLCKDKDFMVKIYAEDDANHITTIEIKPYEEFKLHNTVKNYLDLLEN